MIMRVKEKFSGPIEKAFSKNYEEYSSFVFLNFSSHKRGFDNKDSTVEKAKKDLHLRLEELRRASIANFYWRASSTKIIDLANNFGESEKVIWHNKCDQMELFTFYFF
eukprot:TRINITY_DN7406_c1_g1_i6.p1 TRINITY_DN7406_c1_g1~~TRINITY_DN7406_c1_g1_i6.p1  ORF type:complete len:108 (+),score=18.32 TRINITY_DN7406_c1_g1_i6:230-553(+)